MNVPQFIIYIIILLFWQTEHVLHILQLLEVEGHIGGENHVDYQGAEFPANKQIEQTTMYFVTLLFDVHNFIQVV